jgi:hypothetical protein
VATIRVEDLDPEMLADLTATHRREDASHDEQLEERRQKGETT